MGTKSHGQHVGMPHTLLILPASAQALSDSAARCLQMQTFGILVQHALTVSWLHASAADVLIVVAKGFCLKGFW